MADLVAIHNPGNQIIFLGPYIVPLPKHHQATQTENTVECSLLSNCLPKINQSWTHLSWTHQCHRLLNWKRNRKNRSRLTANRQSVYSGGPVVHQSTRSMIQTLPSFDSNTYRRCRPIQRSLVYSCKCCSTLHYSPRSLLHSRFRSSQCSLA